LALGRARVIESTAGSWAVGFGAGEGSVGGGALGAGCAGAAGVAVGSTGAAGVPSVGDGAGAAGAELSGAGGAGTSWGCCGLQATSDRANKMTGKRVFIALPQLTVTVTSKSPGVPWSSLQPFEHS
jgi:hypothetical protein